MRLMLVWAGVIYLAAGCAAGSHGTSEGELTLGTWGGENAGVIVTDSVSHVHVGCTFGDFPNRLTVDATGRFSVSGTYVLKAFPIQLGPTLPAQFSGRIVRRTLTLSVAVNDTTTGKVVTLGPVTVRFGDAPALGPCPICRVPGMGRLRPATSEPAEPAPRDRASNSR